MCACALGSGEHQASTTESMATAARRSAVTGSRQRHEVATVRKGPIEEEQEEEGLTVWHTRWPVVV